MKMNQRIRRQLLGTAVLILVLLAASLLLLRGDGYPLSPQSYHEQLSWAGGGYSEDELDGKIAGYTKKWVREDGKVCYIMEPDPSSFFFLPRLDLAIIVEFNADGKSISAEWADL